MRLKLKESGRYIIIILLQILVIVYWANIKTNYHVDELYSMGYASNFTGVGDKAQYITTSPEFSFNKWTDNSEFKKYLIVSEEEGVFGTTLTEFISRAITGRNYMALLNIAHSIAGYQQVSAVPGLVLNIIFYIITEIALISLMRKLKMDEYVILLAGSMFGFSGYMIGMAEYIRFYMLVIMFMLLMLNCFFKLWNADSWDRIIGYEIIIMLLEYLSFKDSEFAIPFFGAFMLCFMLALIATKKWKQTVSFGVICLCGILYVFVTQDLIQTLIDPVGNISEHGVYADASMNIRNVSITTLRGYFTWLNDLLETQYVSSHLLTYLLIAAITMLLIISVRKEADNLLNKRTKGIRSITVIMFVIWCAIFAASAILKQGSFISIIVLTVIALVGVGEALGLELPKRKLIISSETVFICVLVGETIIFTLFDALCRYEIWRYYCYGFVSISIIAWYFVDRALKVKELQSVKRKLAVILTVFVVINALLPFDTRKIENMYEDEKAFVESVRENQNLDVVLISEVEDGTVSRHEMYDLVNMVPEDARIYAVDKCEYNFDDVDYPNSFILWSYIDRDLSTVLNDLKSHGYSVRELGEDHCSKAYVCNYM